MTAIAGRGFARDSVSPPETLPTVEKPRQRLTPRQIAAMAYMMRLFVEDDLALGVLPQERIHCSACDLPRPRAGAIPYDSYLVCNECATEYEVARATDEALSFGGYLHDKRYGDGYRYQLPEELRADRSTQRPQEPRPS